jgi:hypothetical protein
MLDSCGHAPQVDRVDATEEAIAAFVATLGVKQ